MGQKVNPISQRLGIIKTWNSNWYANKKNFAKFLHQDIKIQQDVSKYLQDCNVSKVEIERNNNNISIYVSTAKPGLILGRQSTSLEKLKEILEKKYLEKISINLKEIKKPELESELIAYAICKQIEKRVSYRRASKMAIAKAMESGAMGIKILVSGRLNGVDIARNEYFSEGKIPLHTFRADIDYAYHPAFTTYGAIGVKVWIYKGEIFKKQGLRASP